MAHAAEEQLGKESPALAAEYDEIGLILLGNAQYLSEGRTVPDIQDDLGAPFSSEPRRQL